MGQALYRKYRSKSLDEIVGQEHITDTLQQALASDRLSHAYLFTGPRGVGKTSIARILAHEINKLPYADDQNHIDIIEIDAASNRRIDEIRDLRDKVNIAPAIAKYKVYIIDEVHMLTKEAFNALLKTLEEPPAHVVFILATTESHKLPATIVSRTQRFVFRPIDVAKAVDHLGYIAKQEKITVDAEALELLAQHSDGSFRDSISLLDQAANAGQAITVGAVRDMLGIPSAEATTALLTLLEKARPAKELLALLADQYTAGLQPIALAESLAASIRQRIIDDTINTAWATQLLNDLLAVNTAMNPERYLEIILLSKNAASTVQVMPVAAEVPPVVPKAPKPAPKIELSVEKQPTPEVSKKPAAEPAEDLTNAADETKWVAVLASLKRDYNTLYGIVRMAKPDFNQPDAVHLTFAFAFHEKRVKEAKNQQAISQALTTVFGKPLAISCSVDPDLKLATKSPKTSTTALPPVPEPPKSDTSLSAISNIFGAAEVLE